MTVQSILWRLASPYDAYVAHVSRLEDAVAEIQYLVQRALGYEAGLQGSVRIVPGGEAAAERAERFRSALAEASTGLSEAEFEDFLAHLGGGSTVDVEADRARTVSRLTAVTSALERHFITAARELALLEARAYSPTAPGVARLLRENRIPARTLTEYRHLLRELASQVGHRLP